MAVVESYPTVNIHFPADMRMPTNEHDDPLTRALAPPLDETAEERTARIKKEIEAQRVSDAIDEAIKQEKSALKKRRAMKMLLLGQSESGTYLSAHCVPMYTSNDQCTRRQVDDFEEYVRPIDLCHTDVARAC